MKMKRLVSLCLVLCLCLAMLPATASAARSFTFETSLADELYAMGLFRGVTEAAYGQSVDFALGRAPTRTEALVMLIRTLGKEQEALSGSWSHPFTDVAKWADPYVGYAYENGLTRGISETKFGTDNATCVQYVTFMLRALGYDDARGDFKWDAPYELAWSCQILPGIVDTHAFLRADVVIISYAALAAKLKGSETTLAQKLIAADALSQSMFAAFYRPNAIAEESAPKALSAEEVYAKCASSVFYIEVADAYGRPISSGSGFFISTEGVAVTNYHVIKGGNSATITTSDTQKTYNVKGVWSYSVEQDWAVLQIDGRGFNSLRMADADSVLGGQTVYAIGSPLGLQNSITQGIISNAHRMENGVRYLQTSAAISPGSSGGALLNEFGHVVGITSASYTEGQNLNLALPISVVMGYSTAALKSLGTVAAAQNEIPEPPKEIAVKKQIVALLRTWIEQNRTDLGGNPVYKERGELDGDKWELNLYHTGTDSVFCRFYYYFAQNNQASATYLLLDPKNVDYEVHYQYYLNNESYISGKTTIRPETWDLTLQFAQYDGAEKNRGFLQRDAADSLDLILWLVNYLMEGEPQFFGGADITTLGFPRPTSN